MMLLRVSRGSRISDQSIPGIVKALRRAAEMLTLTGGFAPAVVKGADFVNQRIGTPRAVRDSL